MDQYTIKPDDIVEHPRWNEPLRVHRIEPKGNYFRLIGHLIHSQHAVDVTLTREEFGQLRAADLRTSFNASPDEVFLALEALRYRYASLYDPLLAMNISKVDPLPHQIEAVYGYVLHQNRIRFLIADDPGAGKTIMAGLIIKELKLRGLIKRILIVTPGHLKAQWQRELKERFDEHFVIIDRNYLNSQFGVNVWQQEFQVITSLDFVRQDRVRDTLSTIQWDFVVVDEAHKLAAYRYGNKIQRTKRYRLGELLSQNSVHLLFLTATPHRGDAENFRLFLDLLQPGIFATPELIQESIQNADNPLFIRRLKEDLRDFEGRPLFLPRHVKTVTFRLGLESTAEAELYNALSRYVEEQYNKALSRQQSRNIAFALVILQRRLASSTYALYRSLLRRKERLEEMLKKADTLPKMWHVDEDDLLLEDIEDITEEERWKQEEIWETLSVAENRQELEREIQILEKLIQQAKAIIEQGDEVKLRHLRASLEELHRTEPNEKILIFTESRDTLEYLEQKLRKWNYTVCTIHGAMPLEERIRAESVFKNEAQIMVATEAAGEGINLQFCHLMINYDIPWNPNRLEQRMGRIHRYGQTHEVTVFNLVAEDTREGRVLKRLFEKIEEIRNALGSDRVFDVIDEILPGRDLSRLLVEAAATARTLDEILKDIDIQVDEKYLERIKLVLGESLATRFIDYTRIHEMAAQARENRLIPEYTQAFFEKAWKLLGGEMHRVRDSRPHPIFTISRVPPAIRSIANADDFRRRFGILLDRYPRITFDKDVAMQDALIEFVSFGHPLFEAMLTYIEKHLTQKLQHGAVFTDPDSHLNGLILFYEGEVRDGLGEVAGKRLFALYLPVNGEEPQIINPAILWDLQPGGQPPSSPLPYLDALEEQSFAFIMTQLESYRYSLYQERQKQANIKRKYGLRSLDELIVSLDNDIIELEQRKEQGEELDLVINNKRQQKREYERAKEQLKNQIERELTLTSSTPKLRGIIWVVPAENKPMDAEMRSDALIEQIGMQLARQYEERHGRQPEDVSAQNLGFDLRSSSPDQKEVRYIEVKARADEGGVLLTRNEWFKASQLGDTFYLYVVLRAASDPQLYIIRNPAARLKPDTLVDVRYHVDPNSIFTHAETPKPEEFL